MIIKVFFRNADGGFEAYLTRNEPGHAVKVRTDLMRGAPSLRHALRLMAAMAAIKGIQRAYVHAIISPDHALSDAELARTLAVIEREYGLSTSLRAAVQHDKGVRAAHVHAAYPILDDSGKRISSHNSFEKDELISRLLEVEFGERIVAGPHLDKNIIELRRRGWHGIADHLEPHLHIADGDALSPADRKQASRVEVDEVALRARVYGLYRRADKNLPQFGALLQQAGFSVAAGDQAILVIHGASGFSTSLARLLRREGKARGMPLKLTEQEVAAAFLDASLKNVVRDRGLGQAQQHAATAVRREERLARFEAATSFDPNFTRMLEEFRHRREQDEAEADEQMRARKATLKARRAAILAHYRDRDHLRQQRVDHAFRTAQVFDSPAARKAVFALAAAGVLLTGAGVSAALVAAGVACVALPSRARAKRMAAKAVAARAADSAARRRDLNDVSTKVRLTRRTRLSFDDIPRRDRVLAGLYAVALVRAGSNGTPISGNAERAAAALGAPLVQGIEQMMRRGSPSQIGRLLHWYNGVAASSRAHVINAALSHHAGGMKKRSSIER